MDLLGTPRVPLLLRCGVLALALLGCAPVQLRLTQTDRIHLTTDHAAPDAYRLLRGMETDHRAMVEAFFPCARTEGGEPVEVVALTDEQTFQRLIPAQSRGAGGIFMAHPQRVIPRPGTLALLWQRSGEATRALFRHELSHRLTARCMPQAPGWLDEGLAELLSTAEVEDGELAVGAPPYFFEDHGAPVGRIGRHITHYVPRDRLLDVAALRALPPGGMWVVDDRDETMARYASAWALVAVLATGPAEVRRAFAAYGRALNVGAEEQEAWDEHLGGLPIAALHASFIAEDTRWYTTYPLAEGADSGPVLERALSAREVDLFWARRLAWDAPSGRLEALAHLDALVRREPASRAQADVASLRAAILAEAGDAHGAAQALRWVDDPEAVAFPRLALRLSQNYTSPPLPQRFVELRPGVALSEAPVGPASVRDVSEEELRALTQRAGNAFEHDVLARAWLHLGEFDAALGEAHLAVADDSSCAQCWVTLGLAQIQASDVTRGAGSLRRGGALMGMAHGGQGTWVRRAGLYAYGALGRRMCATVQPLVVPEEVPISSEEVAEPAPAPVASREPALHADSIRAVVRSHLDPIEQCYEDELALNPLVRGTVQVRFTIGPTGAVTGAELHDSELGGVLGCCVLQEVMSWQFPAPREGGLVRVTYPFTLTYD